MSPRPMAVQITDSLERADQRADQEDGSRGCAVWSLRGDEMPAWVTMKRRCYGRSAKAPVALDIKRAGKAQGVGLQHDQQFSRPGAPQQYSIEGLQRAEREKLPAPEQVHQRGE